MPFRSRNPACWISGANCLPAQPAARNRGRTGYAFPQQKSGLLDFRRELSAGTAGRELSAATRRPTPTVGNHCLAADSFYGESAFYLQKSF